MDMTIEEITKTITPLLTKSRVQYAGVFGSVARGEARADSDVDILIKFSDPGTFDAYLQLDESLRNALGKDIDLITEGSINKFMRPSIERDLKIVYGQR